MTTPFDAKNPALFEVPVPPQEFGQDGGKFYHYYDTLADEIDDNMVAGLKEQLDGLLIFAGLFAGVNSAFLALTLPLMSPDPADDTNALLRDNNAILLNIMLGRNDSLPSTNALPSETFSPTGKILTVNVLFSVSLTFALVSSFMAVLGRQWLVYYRKRTGGGPERQSRKLALLIIPLLRTMLWPFGWLALPLHRYFIHGPDFVHWPWEERSDDVKYLLDEYLIIPISSLPDYVKRKEESDGTLQITAVRRAICTSDDARTQAHALSNILGITDADLLLLLATDEEFDARVLKLCADSYNRTLQLCGRDRTDLAAATSWVYRAAITHIFLSTANPDEQLNRKRWQHIFHIVHDAPLLSLSSDLMQNANSNMAITCLGFMAMFTYLNEIQTPSSRRALRSTIDGLVNPSWKCISMITEVIIVQWGIHEGNTSEVHAAWIGKPSTVHQNLKSLLEKSNDPECPDRDILREYLVDVFKLAGKATADSGGDSS
ncbi:hypothetical protein FS837_000684, partial [Tulasnella sp. UAMH 9824]